MFGVKGLGLRVPLAEVLFLQVPGEARRSRPDSLNLKVTG